MTIAHVYSAASTVSVVFSDRGEATVVRIFWLDDQVSPLSEKREFALAELPEDTTITIDRTAFIYDKENKTYGVSI